MSFPTHVGTSAGVSGTVDTFHNFPTLPGGSAGDLLLAIFLCTGNETSLAIGGYTTLFTGHSPSNVTSIIVAYKTATALELVPTVTTSAPCDSVAIMRRFSGWSSVGIGTSGTGTGTSAAIPSHNAGSSADRTWVSVLGSEWDQTAATTPGLSSEQHPSNASTLTLLSGLLNSTSATVSMGTYTLTSSARWVANSVFVEGTGGGVSGSISATLGNVTASSFQLEERMLGSISASLSPAYSLGSMFVFPDTTIVLGNIEPTMTGLVGFPVQLGNVEMGAELRVHRPTARCKVWNGSAWVAAPPKVWDGSAWVSNIDVAVYYAGAWVKVY